MRVRRSRASTGLVTNPNYGGLQGTGRVLIEWSSRSHFGWELRESDDGKYYVTDTGQALHLSPTCGMLWASSHVRKDINRTLAYRVMTRGASAGIRNAIGEPIVTVCESCGPKRVRIRGEGDE